MKKKLLAVAAAGALTAATAVPALALENEFHGMFRVIGAVSNYANNGSGQFSPTQQDPKTNSFVEQRARLLYMAKANDDLKLVTHFEIDSRWGDNSYAVGRNQGAAIGADSVNLETKNVYLDFNIPTTPMNFKVGIQPIVDSYKGVFINTDAAAVLASAKMGNGAVALGFARLDDADSFTIGSANNRSASTPGKATRDLYIVDGKYNLSKDLKVGGSYYAVLADQNATNLNLTLHTVGVNAEYKFDPVTVDGFLLYQLGRTRGTDKLDFNGWAANAAAKAKLGPGTLKASFLYASGDALNGNVRDDQTYRGITNETSTANGEHSFYESDMLIMFRNKYNIGDRAIVYQVQNVIGGFVGYNANITPKAFAGANVGFVAAATDNTQYAALPAGAAEHDSKYLGTELNAEVGYKLFDNLTASLQGAYVVLGDYFKGTATGNQDPRDPYLTRVMLNYAF